MPANKKSTSKKPTSKKSTSKKPTSKKSTSKKPTSKKSGTKSVVANPMPGSTMAKPGDLIVIDSSKVGSPPREGEVLEVVQGQVSVSYRVRWPDGHQSLIAPGAGITHIVPSQRKR
jgi:hypothetical protein